MGSIGLECFMGRRGKFWRGSDDRSWRVVFFVGGELGAAMVLLEVGSGDGHAKGLLRGCVGWEAGYIKCIRVFGCVCLVCASFFCDV